MIAKLMGVSATAADNKLRFASLTKTLTGFAYPQNVRRNGLLEIKVENNEKLSMLKKGDDLIVGNEMMDKPTNRAHLASATAFAQILLHRTSDALGTLDEIFKSKLLRELRGEYVKGDLRRPNANDATGTFNRSRNVAPMSWLCTRFNSCKGDVRSGWHRSEKNH